MIRPLKKESLKIAATTWKVKMKHVISTLIATACMTATVAAAEVKPMIQYWASKPIQCTTAGEMVAIMEKYGENPLIYMDGNVGMPDGTKSYVKFVLAQNSKTHTWTLLEFTEAKPDKETSPDEQVCVLGAGQGMINFNLPSLPGTKI